MGKPILYGAPLSPFVRKVAVVLFEKNIDFEWKKLRPHNDDETFKRISPLGKIPAYIDDEIDLADSSVICFYLEKTYPQTPLYPTDRISHAKAIWFEEYFDGAMVGPMGTIFFQQWLNPTFFDKPADEAAVKDAVETKLPPMLEYVEKQLGGSEWIVGNQFSIADISLAVGFRNIGYAGIEVDKRRYPKLAAYVARVFARPSFQKCIAIEEEFIKEMHVKKAAAAAKNS